MAQIEKRENGSYKITVYLGKNEDGIRKYKRTTYHPKAKTPKAIEDEVRKFADQYEDEVKNGKVYDDSMKFIDLYALWKKNYAEENIKVTSLHWYDRTIHNIWMPELGFMPIGSISAAFLQEILAKLQKTKTPKTVRNDFAAIRAVLTKAYKWGMIRENPCDRVDLPKVKKQEKVQSFTVDQAKSFLASIEDPFWQAFYTLAIYGGFRRGELLGLQWRDINFKKKTVKVERAVSRSERKTYVQDPKTAGSKRTIPLPDICFAKLKAVKPAGKVLEKDMWVFTLRDGNPLSTSTPDQRFRIDIERYNEQHQDRLPKIRLHDLRHTTATLLIGAGVDPATVAHILGHEDMSTTNIYVHTSDENMRRAADTLALLLNG